MGHKIDVCYSCCGGALGFVPKKKIRVIDKLARNKLKHSISAEDNTTAM